MLRMARKRACQNWSCSLEAFTQLNHRLLATLVPFLVKASHVGSLARKAAWCTTSSCGSSPTSRHIAG
eukprot:3902017-Lingulodinium_polyedra.AAC.1